MPVSFMGLIIVCALIAGVLLWAVRAYNRMVELRNRIANAFGQIDVQLKRRHDLIPNLVNTVKGYAAQEKEVLLGVTEARSRVGQVQQQANPTDPGSLKQFESAQAQMSSALSRLLGVAERYPELKSDQNFRELQAELAGTENRITVARKRYIDSINAYNVLVREFPVNLTAKVLSYAPKPQFSVENEAAISKPPTVDFGGGQSAPAAQPAPAAQ